MARETLGEVEQLVLLAILRLGEDAYGVPIIEEIGHRTGREVKRAAVYIALRRLRRKELVESWLADPEPVQGGRAKRYYRVLPAGIDLLAEQRSTLMSMWDGLHPLLEKR